MPRHEDFKQPSAGWYWTDCPVCGNPELTGDRAKRSPAAPAQHELPKPAGATVGIWCHSKGLRIASATRCEGCGNLAPGEPCGRAAPAPLGSPGAPADNSAASGVVDAEPVVGAYRVRDGGGFGYADWADLTAHQETVEAPAEARPRVDRDAPDTLEGEVVRCIDGDMRTSLTPSEEALARNLHASKQSFPEIARAIRLNRKAVEYFRQHPTMRPANVVTADQHVAQMVNALHGGNSQPHSQAIIAQFLENVVRNLPEHSQWHLGGGKYVPDGEMVMALARYREKLRRTPQVVDDLVVGKHSEIADHVVDGVRYAVGIDYGADDRAHAVLAERQPDGSVLIAAEATGFREVAMMDANGDKMASPASDTIHVAFQHDEIAFRYPSRSAALNELRAIGSTVDRLGDSIENVLSSIGRELENAAEATQRAAAAEARYDEIFRSYQAEIASTERAVTIRGEYFSHNDLVLMHDELQQERQNTRPLDEAAVADLLHKWEQPVGFVMRFTRETSKDIARAICTHFHAAPSVAVTEPARYMCAIDGETDTGYPMQIKHGECVSYAEHENIVNALKSAPPLQPLVREKVFSDVKREYDQRYFGDGAFDVCSRITDAVMQFGTTAQGGEACAWMNDYGASSTLHHTKDEARMAANNYASRIAIPLYRHAQTPEEAVKVLVEHKWEKIMPLYISGMRNGEAISAQGRTVLIAPTPEAR